MYALRRIAAGGLLVALTLPFSGWAQTVGGTGSSDMIDWNAFRAQLRSYQPVEPGAGNVKSSPEHLEKKCFDDALRHAYRQLQAALNTVSFDFEADEALGGKADERFAAALDAAGSDKRGQILLNLTQSRTAAEFANQILGEDATDEQTKTLTDLHEAFGASKLSLLGTSRDAEDPTCENGVQIRMTHASASYYILTAVVTADCDCDAEDNQGKQIRRYTIEYNTDVSMSFLGINDDEEISLGMEENPSSPWTVVRLACCKRDRDEDTGVAPGDNSAAEVRPSSGGHASGTGEYALNPFAPNAVCGSLGYSTGGPFQDDQLDKSHDLMLGAMYKRGIGDQLAVGAGFMYSYESNKGEIEQRKRNVVDLQAELSYFPSCLCGGGPVRPVANVVVGYGFGAETQIFSGYSQFEQKDNISRLSAELQAGLVADIGNDQLIGLNLPIVHWLRETRSNPDFPDSKFTESQITTALNKKAISFQYIRRFDL